jgi:hypothetical protein
MSMFYKRLLNSKWWPEKSCNKIEVEAQPHQARTYKSEDFDRLFNSENKVISCNIFSPSLTRQSSKILQEFESYSHLSNSRRGGNKRGGGAKVPE